MFNKIKKHIIYIGKCLNCKKEMNYWGCTKEECSQVDFLPDSKTVKEGIVEKRTNNLYINDIK